MRFLLDIKLPRLVSSWSMQRPCLFPIAAGHGVVASSPGASAQPKNHSKSAPLLLVLDPICVIQQQPLQKPKPQKLTQQQSGS